MIEINKVVVIGAGTMGAGISSHLANAGIAVTLLDIVPTDAEDRNIVASRAVDRMLKSSPPAFMENTNAQLITVGNIEDDMELLAEADWIVEAVVERLDIKHRLYKAIDEVRKPNAIISSNTSTIPLQTLISKMPDSFAQDFCITHFFNPVRYMRLLEIVSGPRSRGDIVETLSLFCEAKLGKGIVPCHDTPGFLGNRVGVYALQVGVTEAAQLGLTIEQADAVMGRPMGIPKTGVFGLYDLIGLDLMVDAVASLSNALPAEDAFHAVEDGIPFIPAAIAKGYNGNKGKGGFYRLHETNGETIRQSVNLQTGEYADSKRLLLDDMPIGKASNLRELVEVSDIHGQFAWRVLAKVLSYSASLLPAVTDDPFSVDEAMKLGYSWNKGPFEMIDELGPAWFKSQLQKEGRPVPAALDDVGAGTFYRANNKKLERKIYSQRYSTINRNPGVARLGDITRTRKPIISNTAASLWDVDDGVACVEFHSKANALAPDSMEILQQSLGITERDFTALLIHNDAPHFSVGFNIEFALNTARAKAWQQLDSALHAFQMTCKACKYADFPVVSAPAGMGVGGGFEVLVQSDALVAHSNINFGLVETMVGVVPSGGGCKEMLHRWTEDANNQADLLKGALKVFEIIGMAKTASSPALAKPMRMFLERDQYCMNRDRLLVDGKNRALELAKDYQAPEALSFTAIGAPGIDAMHEMLDQLNNKGITTPHDLVVAKKLAWILTGGGRDAGVTMSEDDMLKLERDAFLELSQSQATIDRISHMLTEGKPLRN